MNPIRSLGSFACGILAGFVGLVAIAVSIALMIASIFHPPKLNDWSVRIFLGIYIFLICEMLLAFGVTAILYGIRCIIGSKNWIESATNYTWTRSMKFAAYMGSSGIVFGVLASVLKFIMKLL